MGKKATKAEVQHRVTTVIAMIVNGFTTERILQYGADEWCVGTRQMFNYIAKADKRIGESAAVDRDYEIGKAIRRLNHLYSACVVAKRFGDALRTQAEINKLLGLYEPARLSIEHATAENLMEHKPETELDQIIREYEARTGGVGVPDGGHGPH